MKHADWFGGMCPKFALCEWGSTKLFNSFRFTDKAVQTGTLLRSGVPRWPFHYFFERNGYLMGNWMDGKCLWSSLCGVFLPGNVVRLVSGSPILFQGWDKQFWRKKVFGPRGRGSKWTANYPCTPASSPSFQVFYEFGVWQKVLWEMNQLGAAPCLEKKPEIRKLGRFRLWNFINLFKGYHITQVTVHTSHLLGIYCLGCCLCTNQNPQTKKLIWCLSWPKDGRVHRWLASASADVLASAMLGRWACWMCDSETNWWISFQTPTVKISQVKIVKGSVKVAYKQFWVIYWLLLMQWRTTVFLSVIYCTRKTYFDVMFGVWETAFVVSNFQVAL